MDASTHAPPDTWYAAFDALRSARPAHAAALAAQFPEFKNEVLGERVFGTQTASDRRRAELARAAIEAILEATTASLDQVLARLRSRARGLAALRLTTSLVALVGSAGVIAAVLQDAGQLRLAAAIIGFIGAAGSLLTVFLEDPTGGEGSTARIRETIFEHVGTLALIRGRLHDPRFTGADDIVGEMMDRLNEAAADIQKARSRLGLPLQGA